MKRYPKSIYGNLNIKGIYTLRPTLKTLWSVQNDLTATKDEKDKCFIESCRILNFCFDRI